MTYHIRHAYQIRCCALATTISWFYESIDRQLAAETVAQAQRRIVRRKLVNTNARSWRCRPPSLAPNSVLVSRPVLVNSQRVNEINESTILGIWYIASRFMEIRGMDIHWNIISEIWKSLVHSRKWWRKQANLQVIILNYGYLHSFVQNYGSCKIK